MSKKNVLTTFFISVLTLLMSNAFIPLALAEKISAEENIWDRPYLTGNWGGLRPSLVDKGVSLNLDYTSTYQGLLSGTGSDDYEYAGKLDAFIKLDSAKLGLWSGGGFNAHLEYNHGEANAFRGGALWPVNTSKALPLGAPEKVAATSLYFTQQVGQKSAVLFGKINVVDLLAADPFFGGWGNKRFMNVAFVAPPSGVLPPTIFGVIASVRTKPIAWTFMVFDPNDRTTDYFPDDLFSDGVNASITSAYSYKLAGRKTTVSVNAAYSSKDGKDLSDTLLPPGVEAGTKDGSYNFSFQFSHNLQESTKQPDSSWGVFLKMNLADGNPNPIKGSLMGGIGGKALFMGRPQDSFGLGYFYYDFSNKLQKALDPVIDLDDEQGLELFYSHAVTPWLHITGDIQYINPASGSNNNAFVTGLRTNIRF